MSLANVMPFLERVHDELSWSLLWSRFKACSLEWNLGQPILKQLVTYINKDLAREPWYPVEFRPAEFQIKRIAHKQRPVGRKSSYLMGTVNPTGVRWPWCWRTLFQLIMDVSKWRWEKNHWHTMLLACICSLALRDGNWGKDGTGMSVFPFADIVIVRQLTERRSWS